MMLFDQALAVGQGAPAANNLVGIGLWLAGRWRRAHPLIERAMRDYPYPMLRVYAAQWQLYVEGKVDEIIAELGQALAMERNQTRIEQFGLPQLIGVAHLVRGEWPAAIAHLENAHAIGPREHGPLAALVAAHVLAGARAEAERLAAAFRERNPDGLLHKAFFRRACLHPERSGIEPASPIGQMICKTVPEALHSVGLAWALPPEDVTAAD
jgi:tetratricopeptide (TPR) repeat protein